MSNYTFQIKDCAIVSKPFISPAKNYISGRLHFQEGSIDFEKSFHSFSPEVIAQVEACWGAESRFSIDAGTLTKKSGKKGTNWKNKMFEEIVVEKMTITNGAQKFSARELVDEALSAQEEENDSEIPF